MEFLAETPLGNPHSENPVSKQTHKLIEETADMLLSFWNAGDEYELIFTPNATGALKLFAESYPWNQNTTLVLSKDNHNSVRGMREYARRAGARVESWGLDEELRLTQTLSEILERQKGGDSIVAFPAQSNFSGVMHPLQYVQEAKKHGALVILDPAAFIPTHRLDLHAINPDVACISFYKIMGFPTGVGALIIRKELLKKLRRPWFSGGTVKAVGPNSHLLRDNHEAFEDGTVNFKCIPLVRPVLEFIKGIGGIEVIESHVKALTEYALEKLRAIKNVVIYGPKTMEAHGGTIAINIIKRDGRLLDHNDVIRRAADRKISMRNGCFCNPEALAEALQMQGEGLDQFVKMVEQDPAAEKYSPGAVRISFGIGNDKEDIQRTVAFLEEMAAVS